MQCKFIQPLAKDAREFILRSLQLAIALSRVASHSVGLSVCLSRGAADRAAKRRGDKTNER